MATPFPPYDNKFPQNNASSMSFNAAENCKKSNDLSKSGIIKQC
jgi:hypothetical protein